MVLKHLYTLLVVLVGFVIFRADNMGQAFSMGALPLRRQGCCWRSV